MCTYIYMYVYIHISKLLCIYVNVYLNIQKKNMYLSKISYIIYACVPSHVCVRDIFTITLGCGCLPLISTPGPVGAPAALAVKHSVVGGTSCPCSWKRGK